jgi:hypothetical protein
MGMENLFLGARSLSRAIIRLILDWYSYIFVILIVSISLMNRYSYE